MTNVPDLPRPMPDAVLLEGRSVDLERLDPARHGAALWTAIGAAAALWRDVPPGPFADEASFAAWLKDRGARSDQALYAIVEKGARRNAVGLFFLINIDNAVGRIEMGLMYGPRLSRRTAGTEAFLLLARYVFEGLGYRRFEWRCNPDNVASMQAARRYGFTLEGVLRQNTWLKGRNWDTAVFAIIDSEWPACAARLDAWLDPANFDAEGRQRRPLAAGPQ